MIAEQIEILRSLEVNHETVNGTRKGFFMPDVTAKFGTLAKASDVVSSLMVEGFIDCHPVIIDGEVETLMCISTKPMPVIH